MKKFLLAFLALAIPSQALADTFIVDIEMKPGAHFEDVQKAVNSPLVKDGDVLLVHFGDYPAFTTSKSIAIRGLGSFPAGTKFDSGAFTNCSGPVRMNNIRFSGSLSLTACTGVVHVLNAEAGAIALKEVRHARFERVLISESMFGQFGAAPVDVSQDSGAEFLSCEFRGGMDVSSMSWVRLVDTFVNGQDGSNVQWPWESHGGDGKPAITVKGGSRMEFMGKSGDSIQGGRGGWGWDIFTDGKGASAIIVEPGSSVRNSNYSLIGGFDPEQTVQAPGYYGDPSSLVVPLIPDPVLTRTGVFLPSQTATFSVEGPPNAPYILFGGTASISKPLPGIIGVLSTLPTLILDSGNLDSAGLLAFDLVMPPIALRGLIGTVQASVVYVAEGAKRLSNPATVFVEHASLALVE